MWLESLSVENCRSIERASLQRLAQINVLIGRNNAGKSAFLHALWFLAQKAQGGNAPWKRTVRNANQNLTLAITVRCSLDDDERGDFIRRAFHWSNFNGERYQKAMASPLARLVEFRCTSVGGNPELVHLEATKLLCEDQQWAEVQRLTGARNIANPLAQMSDFSAMDAVGYLPAELVALGGIESKREANLHFQNWGDLADPGYTLQRLFTQLLKRFFFFQPSRRSEDALPATVGTQLTPDGRNLPQVLLDVRTNNEDRFNAITQIIEGAVPDVGRLHTPMSGNSTQIGFRRPGLADPIPLHDMGTGVQQLLMMAVLLETTGSDTPLCIEEPELNLHPGAQRFLLERLQTDKGRQVFMSTHSPVFLNAGPTGAVYRIEIHDNRSQARRIENSGDLARALAAIGARNSDVLLSDAVLFVEGESDRVVLSIWARLLGHSLESRNIAVLLVGSTEAARTVSRPRADLLQAISRGSPVPHRFVLDSDERSAAELRSLREALADTLVILSRREIENFFLESELIAQRIAERLRERGREVPDGLRERIQPRMLEIARSLRGVVLIKRIRAALPRLEGGPFPRELANEIARRGIFERLAEEIEGALREHYGSWLERARLREVVAEETRRTQEDWQHEDSILRHVPGADVLEQLFTDFGLVYDKKADGTALARAMRADQVPAEIAAVLRWDPNAPPG